MRLLLALSVVAVSIAMSCGPAKGPDGKSVVVSTSTSTQVKDGVYSVGFGNGVISREEDGGIIQVGMSASLTPPSGTGLNGLYIATRDLTVGKAQALSDVAANQVGFALTPLEKQPPSWFANGGTLTVKAFGPSSMTVSVIGATMQPLPTPPGATGTFTLDVDLQINLIEF